MNSQALKKRTTRAILDQKSVCFEKSSSVPRERASACVQNQGPPWFFFSCRDGSPAVAWCDHAWKVADRSRSSGKGGARNRQQARLVFFLLVVYPCPCDSLKPSFNLRKHVAWMWQYCPRALRFTPLVKAVSPWTVPDLQLLSCAEKKKVTLLTFAANWTIRAWAEISSRSKVALFDKTVDYYILD